MKQENGQEIKKVNRIYWVWQFEEEEQWLNRMAAEGWVLQKARIGQYVFARCEPGEYILRLEILDQWPGSEKSRDYIRFVESTGAEYICSLKRWVYFRQKAAEGEFALFSDLNSRIRHIDRVLVLLGALELIEALGLLNILRYVLLPLNVAEQLAVVLCAALLAAMAVWIGRGLCKIWRVRKRLQAERDLRE